ncbi:MAG: coproporphyrinogen III oxidase family protein [Brevinematales bacterium]|nr:coproporphyrinogen III oxidase family protein [Brevinematales bacterium]
MMGLYVHIPFCRHKCIYCHFISGIPYNEERAERYIDFLLQEAKLYRFLYGHLHFHTLYLGGGTPSLLSERLLFRLVEGLSSLFTLEAEERTLEVNPEDVNEEHLTMWKKAGFTRLSLGFQAVQPELLAFLSRPLFDPDKTYEMVREKGFSKVSVDFIVGTPLLHTHKLLKWIRKHLPPHLSLYLLSCESGSTLAGLERQGLFSPPPEEFQAKQYLTLAKKLSCLYEWYEISNFSMGTQNRSLHNSLYWAYEPYIGLGIGASGFLSWKKFRYTNTIHLPLYERLLQKEHFPYGYEETLGEKTEKMEKLMLGLRTSEGIPLSTLKEWATEKGWQAFERTVQRLAPYLEYYEEKLILTPEGRMVANTLITELWCTLEPFL